MYRVCPHSLLIRGPSEGMCRQYHQMLQRSMQMLSQWAHFVPELDDVHMSTLVATREAFTHSTVGQEPHTKSPSRDQANDHPKAKAHGQGQGHDMFSGMRGGFFSSKPTASPLSATNSTATGGAKIKPFVPSPLAPSVQPKADNFLWALPGGCAIELALFFWLQNLTDEKSSPATASATATASVLSENKSQHERAEPQNILSPSPAGVPDYIIKSVLRVFGVSLLALPDQLVRNWLVSLHWHSAALRPFYVCLISCVDAESKQGRGLLMRILPALVTF